MNGNNGIKAKNILLFANAEFPFGSAGANVLRLLTTGLVHKGRNVTVLLPYGRKQKNIKTSNTIDGVCYRYCSFLIQQENYLIKIIDTILGLVVSAWSLIAKKRKQEVDLVLLYSSRAYTCLPIWLLCKLLNIPVINHVVEWYEKDTFVIKSWQLLLWWDFLFRMKFLNKYFSGLMVTSSFLKNYYTERNVDARSILIVPNLVNISAFKCEDKHGKEKQGKIRIGYCGSQLIRDGISDLLAAFKIVHEKYSDTELLVIGDISGSNSQVPTLKKLAVKMKIECSVIFTGRVKWERMSALLNSCDILVLSRPSGRFAEAGFPTKLGEYMSCKKPVVATAVGDIPLYLKDKEDAMIAQPDNPESVASKICYLIKHPKEAEYIGMNGYRWAQTKLDYHKATQTIGLFFDSFITVTKIENIYSEVIRKT